MFWFPLEKLRTRRVGVFLSSAALISAIAGFSAGAVSASGIGNATTTPKLVLKGTIRGPSGKPVSNAFIWTGSSQARTNSTGQYELAVKAAPKLTGSFWGPGALLEQFTYPLGSITDPDAAISMPPFKLISIFDNTLFDARMTGLNPVMTSAVKNAHIRGWSRYPVESKLYVTAPSGWVHTYGLHTNGQHYWGTVPFHANGQYVVEILASNGLSLFDVPVFRGVTPKVPLGPSFPPAPKTSDIRRLADYTLGLINRTRKQIHLRPLVMNHNVRMAAQGHSDDMARYGYYYSHPHVGSDGSTPGQRLTRHHVSFTTYAEGVALAKPLSACIDSLLMSPAHRLILQGSYRRAGIGLARWDHMWLTTIDLVR